MSQMDAAADIREVLTAAGIGYPMNWDELGSSEKDLWEERQYRALQKRTLREANSAVVL